MASSIGSHYRCSVFGESHGEMIGVEIDGMPPGERSRAGAFHGASRTGLEQTHDPAQGS